MRGFAAVLLLALGTAVHSAAASSYKLTVRTPQLPLSGRGWLAVAVTDATTGELAPRETMVVVESLKSASGAISVRPEERMWFNEDGTFGADIFKLHKALGLYTLTLAASGGGSGETSRQTVEVAVTGKVTVLDAKASVETAASRDSYPLTVGQPMPETLFLPDETAAKVVITFTVQQGSGEGFAPHQAMVRATHAASGAAAFVRAKSGDDGYHRATFGPSDLAAQVNGRGGLYDLALLIGDAAIDTPIHWDLGQVDVAGSEVVAAPSVVPSARRPEIHHVFRAPDRRTPAAVSLLFSAFQVVAVVVLGAALLHITGGRLRGLPASAGGWVAALGFHGGLASVLGLYLVFWVDLTVLQMLPYLAVLGSGTAAFGFFCLSHLATTQVRAKKQ